jgi:hypothetical protein
MSADLQLTGSLQSDPPAFIAADGVATYRVVPSCTQDLRSDGSPNLDESSSVQSR